MCVCRCFPSFRIFCCRCCSTPHTPNDLFLLHIFFSCFIPFVQCAHFIGKSIKLLYLNAFGARRPARYSDTVVCPRTKGKEEKGKKPIPSTLRHATISCLFPRKRPAKQRWGWLRLSSGDRQVTKFPSRATARGVSVVSEFSSVQLFCWRGGGRKWKEGKALSSVRLCCPQLLRSHRV